MRRGLFLALLAQVFVGCGPEAALWVRVEAPLRIPTECNALRLEVWTLDGAGQDVRQAYVEETSLDSQGLQFPLTKTLTAESPELLDSDLRVEATAIWRPQPTAGQPGTAEISHVGEERVRLVPGELTHTTIRLCIGCAGRPEP